MEGFRFMSWDVGQKLLEALAGLQNLILDPVRQGAVESASSVGPCFLHPKGA